MFNQISVYLCPHWVGRLQNTFFLLFFCHLLPHLIDNNPLSVKASDELTLLRVLVPGHHLDKLSFKSFHEYHNQIFLPYPGHLRALLRPKETLSPPLFFLQGLHAPQGFPCALQHHPTCEGCDQSSCLLVLTFAPWIGGDRVLLNCVTDRLTACNLAPTQPHLFALSV